MIEKALVAIAETLALHRRRMQVYAEGL